MNLIKKALKYIALLFFLPLWWIQKCYPRNKKIWIFGCWNGLKYSDNTRVLFEHISEDQDIKCIWLTKSRDVYNNLKNLNKTCATTYSLQGIIYSLRAGVVIVSSGKQDVNPLFINGAKIINTWHGAPMKRIGLDDHFESTKFKYSIIRLLYPFLNEYSIDGIVSTADIFSPIMGSAFNLTSDKVLCTGYPRNDVFYSNLKHPIIDKWNEVFEFPIKIFYLPTFRDHSSKFNPFLSFDFNESVMNNFLMESNSILISKGHFVDKKIGEKSNFERIIHLSDNDVGDLNFILKDIDILITDYSGVFFDFLLTHKKIVFAPFDIDVYTSKYRQLYFNYEEITCGPVAYDWNEVIEVLNKIIISDPYIELRNQRNILFNKFNDGNNSLRLYKSIRTLLNLN